MNDQDFRISAIPAPSAVKIFFAAGFVLFPVIPAILTAIAFASAKPGDPIQGMFSAMLIVIGGISGITGISILMTTGFVLLIRGISPSPGVTMELTGSPAPIKTSSSQAPYGAPEIPAGRLDLRGAWSPCLVYLASFTAASFYWKSALQTPQSSMIALVAAVLDGFAVLLFFYFWLAGLLRLNRAGAPIPAHYFFWPAAALTMFFMPLLF